MTPVVIRLAVAIWLMRAHSLWKSVWKCLWIRVEHLWIIFCGLPDPQKMILRASLPYRQLRDLQKAGCFIRMWPGTAGFHGQSRPVGPLPVRYRQDMFILGVNDDPELDAP